MPESWIRAAAPDAAITSLSAGASNGRISPAAEFWHKPVFLVFLVTWAANWVILILRMELAGQARWIESLLPITACATTLLALGRRLPFQNVIMAGLLIGGIGFLITAVAASSGIPFGPIYYTDRFGEKLAGLVPWPIPLLWVMLIINGRGVARLIMRPWRKTNFYGFWVIGFTCLLMVLFDLGLEPFAVKANSYWIWLGGRSGLSWHTAPWVNFPGWFVASLGIIAFTIPWLINKHPVKQPMDYHPLVVWLLLNLWLATGNAAHGLWSAVVVGFIGNVLAATYAIRGARW